MQEQVDKDLWQARQAQSSADDEDEEIARLLAELEGLDAEKVRMGLVMLRSYVSCVGCRREGGQAEGDRGERGNSR